MIKLWDRISHIGINDTISLKSRYIILSNQVSLLIVLLCLLLALMLEGFFGSPRAAPMAAISAIFFILVWVFNYLHLYNFSRLYLTLLTPTIVIAISLLVKINDSGNIEEFEYYDSRLILLATTILPLIIFDIQEKTKLFIALICSFFFLLFYDPIHTLFSVGYFQAGHTSRNYLFINYAMVAAYMFIMSSIFVLKHFISNSESRNRQLIEDLQIRENSLRSKTEALLQSNKEIEKQNQSIRLQAEELETSQEKILEANNIIEEQKKELIAKNRILEMKVHSQDKNMVEINSELIKRNNELRQFGYTISHNLRGPIASLLGLINLFDTESENETNKNVIDHIHSVTYNLEIIIRDLNKIVELRNEFSAEREKIDIKEELKIVTSLIKEDILKTDTKINYNIQQSEAYGVKAYVQSILYNLLSNCIKFRSPERRPVIDISVEKKKDFLKITIKDNGIGFDVQRHQHNLFSLYKRFHTHTPGKGLGLYLTKLQLDTMGGSIKANSKINEGSVFTFYLPSYSNV